MVDALNVITFFWLAFWALLSTKKLAAGSRHSIFFIMIVHFIFTGIPPLLDVLWGKPRYLHSGFVLAVNDDATTILYCLYVSAVPLIWWRTGRNIRDEYVESKPMAEDEWAFIRRWRIVAYILMASPLLIVALAPDPEIYLNYGAPARKLLQFDATSYHIIVTISSMISVLAAIGLIGSYRKINAALFMLFLPWLLLPIWIHGKRNIVALIIVLLGYVLWSKGYLRGRQMFLGFLASIVVLSLLSYSYQAVVRNKSLESIGVAAVYRNIRIDYGRDLVIKLTIYTELHPDRLQILEFRGQSLLFYATMYVPRSLWPQKPLPYAQYMTSAMYRSSPKMWGWGIATSWLEEAIANFGWLGMLIGPLTISYMCRIGDSRHNVIVSGLTVLVAALLLTVHLVAFAPLYAIWIWALIRTRRSKRVKFVPHASG